MSPTDRMVRKFTASMIAAVAQYEEQKRTYADLKQAYTDRYPSDPVTADMKANGDPRVAKANGLAVWHRDDAAMYAAVITALRADEPVRPAQSGGGI